MSPFLRDQNGAMDGDFATVARPLELSVSRLGIATFSSADILRASLKMMGGYWRMTCPFLKCNRRRECFVPPGLLDHSVQLSIFNEQLMTFPDPNIQR